MTERETMGGKRTQLKHAISATSINSVSKAACDAAEVHPRRAAARRGPCTRSIGIARKCSHTLSNPCAPHDDQVACACAANARDTSSRLPRGSESHVSYRTVTGSTSPPPTCDASRAFASHVDAACVSLARRACSASALATRGCRHGPSSTSSCKTRERTSR
jgi:hypothetical protein